MTTFASLGLIEPLQRALAACGYTTPTPIQAEAIPPLLQGRDLIGVAQTGTGKTAAFALPILQQLALTPTDHDRVRALVLSPTRELATQLTARIRDYAQFLEIHQTTLCGGVEEGPQIDALRLGVDLVVATPGRFLDLHRRQHLPLDGVTSLVIDEADRMLDSGFLQELRPILQLLPEDRQTLLFSATLPPAITQLAARHLRDPVRVDVSPQRVPMALIEQQVMFVRSADKVRLLTHLLSTSDINRGLVFVRTRQKVERLVKALDEAGISAAPLHGDRSQRDRDAALTAFREGEARLLIATDLAARGIDVAGVSHIFNFELPHEPEAYIHRIGRTGRAGHSGVAISFCDDSEGGTLRDIERLMEAPIAPVLNQPYHWYDAIPGSRASGRKGGGRRRSRPRRRRKGG